MDTYAEYEKKAEEIRKINHVYLDGYRKHLEAQGLKENTINKHVDNVDFYINYFLLYYDAISAKDGCCSIDGFLGYFFIRKAMWSSVAAIKSNIASIKKFYRYMLDIGVIKEEKYDRLCEIIKNEKENWFATMRRYDDPNEDDPFHHKDYDF